MIDTNGSREFKMKENSVQANSDHQEIFLLLPWYVNKTLHATELERVESHLKTCLVCKREITALQHLSLAVKRADMLESAAQASFSRLRNRLHQTEALPVTGAAFRSGSKGWFHKAGPTSFRSTQTASTLLMVLLLGALIPAFSILGPMLQNGYKTLSSGENPVSVDHEIRVIFAECIARNQIDALVSGIQGHIVGDRTVEGTYLIHLAVKPDAKTIQDALAILRKNPAVSFAEPAYALLSSQPTGGRSQ